MDSDAIVPRRWRREWRRHGTCAGGGSLGLCGSDTSASAADFGIVARARAGSYGYGTATVDTSTAITRSASAFLRNCRLSRNNNHDSLDPESELQLELLTPFPRSCDE